MMFSVTQRGTGAKILLNKTKKLQNAKITPALKVAGKDIVNFTENDVFSSEGSALLGHKWKTLSKPYAQAKAKRYPNKGILEATGKMRKSFRHSVSKSGDIYTLTVENTDKKFLYHQSSKPRSKMPRRQMLKATSKVISKVEKQLAKLYA